MEKVSHLKQMCTSSVITKSASGTLISSRGDKPKWLSGGTHTHYERWMINLSSLSPGLNMLQCSRKEVGMKSEKLRLFSGRWIIFRTVPLGLIEEGRLMVSLQGKRSLLQTSNTKAMKLECDGTLAAWKRLQNDFRHEKQEKAQALWKTLYKIFLTLKRQSWRGSVYIQIVG